MNVLLDHYQKKVAPALKEQFGYKNVNAVPRIKYVVINVGISATKKDAKTEEIVKETLRRITGQQPVPTLAKISISNFKVRQGMTVGMRVTLRGARMYDFVEKLVAVTLPRVRDFRGLKPSIIDDHGNVSIGFRESGPFPEVRAEELERLHGLEVTIGTSAKTKAEGLALFKMLGFPFQEK